MSVNLSDLLSIGLGIVAKGPSAINWATLGQGLGVAAAGGAIAFGATRALMPTPQAANFKGWMTDEQAACVCYFSSLYRACREALLLVDFVPHEILARLLAHTGIVARLVIAVYRNELSHPPESWGRLVFDTGHVALLALQDVFHTINKLCVPESQAFKFSIGVCDEMRDAIMSAVANGMTQGDLAARVKRDAELGAVVGT